MPLHEIPLYQGFLSRGDVELELGDRLHIRLHSEGALGSKPFDTGWRRLDNGKCLVERYRPIVLLKVNLTQLVAAIRNAAKE